MTSFWTIVLLLTYIVAIRSDPICVYEKTNVLCTAGEDNYVLDDKLLKSNVKITNITLTDCLITDVDVNTFKHDINLMHLDLSNNKIRNLKDTLFDANVNLIYLNLSYNALIAFPSGLFAQHTLEVLDLKGNYLNPLKMSVYQQTNLKYLDISDNGFWAIYLSLVSFGKMTQIKYINLSGNNMGPESINFFYNLTTLESLYLDKCSYENMPTFLSEPNLATLQLLSLAKNNISDINSTDIFNNLLNLRSLNLGENAIAKIKDFSLSPMVKLEKINLSHNKLTDISLGLFAELIHLSDIDLSYNSIDYVSVEAVRIDSLKTLNLAFNSFTYLDSHFYFYIGANLKKFYFESTSWQCACLLETLNDVKKFNVDYNQRFYNGENVVCTMPENVNNVMECYRDAARKDATLSVTQKYDPPSLFDPKLWAGLYKIVQSGYKSYKNKDS